MRTIVDPVRMLHADCHCGLRGCQFAGPWRIDADRSDGLSSASLHVSTFSCAGRADARGGVCWRPELGGPGYVRGTLVHVDVP